MSNEILFLRDPATESEVRILPWFGFNCYRFAVKHRGQFVDLLWSQSGIESGEARASGSGIPILFPFPGRISGTVFKWENKQYQLTAGDGRGNAIHGFVLNRPWRVIESSAQRAVGQFQASIDDEALLTCWPADFRITVTYELHGNELRSTLLVENPDERTLPYGLGTHPYFQLPLGGQNAADCVVKLPVRSYWELHDMLPTGRELPLPEASVLRAGRRFADMQYDTVMAGLEFNNGQCVAEIQDPQSDLCLQQSFDRTFRECVVYTPPHREAICIEPYTCVPGSFQMDRAKINAGMRLLQPGDSFETTIRIAARDASL